MDLERDDSTEDTLGEGQTGLTPIHEDVSRHEFSLDDHMVGPLKAHILRIEVENRILEALATLGDSSEEVLIAEIRGIPNEFNDEALAQQLVNHFLNGRWARQHSNRLRQNGVLVGDEQALNPNGSLNSRRLNGSLKAFQQGEIPVRHLIVLSDVVTTELTPAGRERSNVKTYLKNIPLTPERRAELDAQMGPSLIGQWRNTMMNRLRQAAEFFQN